ncbi:unnamed protein product [Arabidopsis thaliana]|uniref:RING-type domain-containing protein n=1 Tax=Arabidopsis thaliana TaxID=3702 RepID=A0A5S9XJQ4_ARATH|nr:unnamed protein product [Arabidopsis thaliana]
MERSVPHHEKFALLMDDVHRIRQQFTSSIPILVTGKQANFTYKLAKETLVSRNIRPMPRTTQKKTCGICFVDDIEGQEMFSAALCSHYFCVECMKQRIKVSLNEETELTESTDDGVRRCCSKCRKPFCIDCNVSWHSNLSCKEYKMKGNKATTTVWLYVLLCMRNPMEAWRLLSSSPIGDETGGRFYGLHCPHFSFFP